MKISCHCGATITDSTDNQSHKGHLLPDQDLHGVWDAIDTEVIDRLASDELSIDEAYTLSRRIMSSPTRTMWQCCECGRLYIACPGGRLHCFVPEGMEPERRILRGSTSWEL